MFRVRLEPGGHEIAVAPEANVLAAALAAGIPLPHSCRAGRCASCKARLVDGKISYPGGTLPPGVTADEAGRGEILLCQARPLSDLSIATRTTATLPARGVLVSALASLSAGGTRVTLRLLGDAPFAARPGQFVEVETAAGGRERVPVVAAFPREIDVEVVELEPGGILRVSGPFATPR